MSRSSSQQRSPSSPRLEMGLKHHLGMDFQKSAAKPWHHRRVQRIALFSVLSVIILGAGLYHQKLQKIYESAPEFSIDSITGLHKYLPTTESQTKLPFLSDAERKTSEKPLTTVPGLSHDKSKVPIDPALVALDHTRVAVLIETRPLPHLPALLLHFIGVLPLQWTVRFMGSTKAIELIERSRALQMYLKTGKLILIDLPPELPVTTQQGLSEVLTSVEFYKHMMAPAEWLLMFQSDSIICAASDYSLDDWVDMGYTWVGAPWFKNVQGGNGGLSLRHVPTIIDLLSDPNVTQRQKGDELFEDRWLGDHLLKKPGTNMPTGEISSHFSVEQVWAERPMGYHLRGSGVFLDEAIWRDEKRRHEVFTYCPEIKIILDGVDMKV